MHVAFDLGISILKGFRFIQYADEISAEHAIRGAQNMEILAHRMGKLQSRVKTCQLCLTLSMYVF